MSHRTVMRRDAPSGQTGEVTTLESVTVGGRTLAYHRAGSGAPLVLLHGGWSNGREWRFQLDGLSADFDVIAWDAPGCGRSDDRPPDATLATYADAVIDLVGALGLHRPHLCGLSFGGGLAIAVYQRDPQLVRLLVLASAYAGWKGSLPPEEVHARLRRVQSEIHRPPESWLDDYLPGFFAGAVAPEVLGLVRSTMLDVRPTGTLPMLTAFAGRNRPRRGAPSSTGSLAPVAHGWIERSHGDVPCWRSRSVPASLVLGAILLTRRVERYLGLPLHVAVPEGGFRDTSRAVAGSRQLVLRRPGVEFRVERRRRGASQVVMWSRYSLPAKAVTSGSAASRPPGSLWPADASTRGGCAAPGIRPTLLQ
jgi:pimeloyl-ACP methyl ester carboxylesterase